MRVLGVIFKKLSNSDYNGMKGAYRQQNGGGQTYIDFSRRAVPDIFLDSFFGQGTPNQYGKSWSFKVNSLSIPSDGYQTATIAARNNNSNALRDLSRNPIYAWDPNHCPAFPTEYDNQADAIIVYIIKAEDGTYWAGWHKESELDHISFIFNKQLLPLLTGECGAIDLSNQNISFDEGDRVWPFHPKGTAPCNLLLQNKSLQKIFYGAPGTGKSNRIKEQTKGNIVIRTTFHPDSDYSTFVGCYKPTTDSLFDKDGAAATEKVTYRYSEQAFIQAYTQAWLELQKEDPQPVFLVIEEINRGNCAQIFGDLFQLLDRSYGYSEYPIVADFDLQKQLKKKFTNLTINEKLKSDINGLFVDQYPDGIVKNIINGELLLLPKNLYIWATMNTSDQSLFPIDSAFKRRWEWEYIKITQPKDTEKDKFSEWQLEGGIKWWKFLTQINKIIASMTSSADKQLGFFFTKPDNGNVISNRRFVNKVIFYLWNDVFKDYAMDEGDLFKFTPKDGTGKELETRDLTYPDFYDDETGMEQNSVIEQFVTHVMEWEPDKKQEN